MCLAQLVRLLDLNNMTYSYKKGERVMWHTSFVLNSYYAGMVSDTDLIWDQVPDQFFKILFYTILPFPAFTLLLALGV